MKAFKFTLKPLRTVRQRREQEAMEAYARALLERSRALEDLHAAERALNAGQAEWQRSAQEGCCAGDLARHAMHCQSLAQRREEKQRLVAEAEREANASLKRMLLARQERAAVDKFLDRQRLAYDRALTREEQKFLDELSQRRTETGLTCALNELPAL
jgi:flagellar export protein FliJ